MIDIKKILAPTDFSDLSVAAIGYAISLAKKHGAEVTVLHALPIKAMQERFSPGYVADGLLTPADVPIGPRRPADVDSIFETKKRLIHDFLQEKIAPEILKSVKISPLIRFGKAVKEIVAAAKEEQCDLIIMASRGSGLARLFAGSVTERVARHAPCPVVSIQPSAEVRTEQDNRVPVTLIDKWAA
jgi:nucleotide-binding universal stress UspA family protein